jgi:hemoglobin-like flavoprotein
VKSRTCSNVDLLRRLPKANIIVYVNRSLRQRGRDSSVRNSKTTGELIVESLELAAARCEDLTPLVYDRLFSVKPETRAMFRADPKNLVKGSMLELAIEAILDFAGERKAGHRLIFCEVQSHDGYGTPPEIFAVFFEVIADTLRDLLGEQWTPDIDAAWRTTLKDLEAYVAAAIKAMQPAA